MTFSLFAYSIITRLLEPFAGVMLNKRVKSGKERQERLAERFGKTNKSRPSGKLIWMHGASVGETAMLLSIFNKLQTSYQDYHLLVTSQTLTSADMIASKANPNITHQMAPIDTPKAIENFLSHWQPDIAVFAEGEIWPNLIRRTRKKNIPLNFINARMTTKTLNGWKKRKNAAKAIFNCFNFIGAADTQTANGLGKILNKPIDTIGNLKRAIEAPSCDPQELTNWQTSIAGRQCFLAASTHSGEDAIVINAFKKLSAKTSNAFLILAPRHPDRAPEIEKLLTDSRLNFEKRSIINQTACAAPVLLADTIGEMGLWMHLAKAIYLGGANKPDVGGHNPIEPLKLRKPVFTGPHSFNFADLIQALQPCKAISIGNDAEALFAFWDDILSENADYNPDWACVDSVFSAVDEPLTLTLHTLRAQLEE